MRIFEIINEDWVPDLLRDFLAKYELHISEKYEYLGEGRHRRGYGNDHIVIKLPITADGMAANEREYKLYKKQVDHVQKSKDKEYLKNMGLTPADPEDEDITKYAKCRLKYVDNIPILIMEKLDTSIKWKNLLPRWTMYVDSSQVGYDKKGKIKAYDFGE